MKEMRFKWGVVAAFLGGQTLFAAEPEAPFVYGFEAMERLDLLPYLPAPGTRTKQFSSYGMAGGNDREFLNFRRYENKGEWVFFDEIGPGCLYRQQMNVFYPRRSNFPAEEARIHFYFDDEETPRLDMIFAEFFGKNGNYTAPFTPPLAYFAEEGRYAVDYYPFPFEKRLRIAAYRADGLKPYQYAWQQFTYHKYPSGTTIKSWSGREVDSPAVRERWRRPGEAPTSLAGARSITWANSVPKGAVVRPLDLEGPASIASLTISLDPWTTDTLFGTQLQITWDNQDKPAVDMPLACFFGAGGNTIATMDLSTPAARRGAEKRIARWGKDAVGVIDFSQRSLKTLLFGFDNKAKTLYAYWPMPFWSNVRIEAANRSGTDLRELKLSVQYKKAEAQDYPRSLCGYFGATRTIDISPDDAYYSQALRLRGHGKVMGVMMYSDDYTMDGDEFTYIDGSRTPQIHGSGTEDDHNQGWGGYAIQQPYWGGLVNGFHGGYRLYIGESYIFHSDIDIRYEHAGKGRKEKTDCITWHYLADPGGGDLTLTDQLDVGNAESERQHEYAISGETWSGRTSASYDKYEHGDPYPTEDDGRAFTGYSQFSVTINADNQGVRLRRRANRNTANVQRANVYVDGRRIPDTPWYVCELPAPPATAFVDTDFEIPASRTCGKSRIAIRIENAPSPEAPCNNEYYYWVYCYGRSPLPPSGPEVFVATPQLGGDSQYRRPGNVDHE